MITQDGLPPFTMHCTECDATWDPPPARGKILATDASLDREAKRHFEACREQRNE